MYAMLAFWTMEMHRAITPSPVDHVDGSPWHPGRPKPRCQSTSLYIRGNVVIAFCIHGMLQLHVTFAFWTMDMHHVGVLEARGNDFIAFYMHGMLQMHTTLAFWTMGMHSVDVMDTRGDDVIAFHIHGMLKMHAALAFWTMEMRHCGVLDT